MILRMKIERIKEKSSKKINSLQQQILDGKCGDKKTKSFLIEKKVDKKDNN